MAYGDLPIDAPLKANKGLEGGACNRQRCQAEPALWYNHGSYSWYCEQCSIDIGLDYINLRDWRHNFERFFPDRTFHPMFETRKQITARHLKHDYEGFALDMTPAEAFQHVVLYDEPEERIEYRYRRQPAYAGAMMSLVGSALSMSQEPLICPHQKDTRLSKLPHIETAQPLSRRAKRRQKGRK